MREMPVDDDEAARRASQLERLRKIERGVIKLVNAVKVAQLRVRGRAGV